MQINRKYSWLKHIDFMTLDLIVLFFSFVISYRLKFGRLTFYRSDAWLRLLLTVCLLNIIITFFINPYSGVLRRSYYQEIVITLKLAVINLVTASVLVYLFKMGASFSRTVFFIMYGFYFALSAVLKCGWKKLLISRKVTLNTTRLIPMFVVCDSANAETVLNNTLAGDFILYNIKGIGFTDDRITADEIKNIPVIRTGFVNYVLENNISDVLIAVPPSSIDTESYRILTNNGINVHFSIEAAVGYQTEEQYVSNIGVYNTLSVGSFTATPSQLFYLRVKRLADIILGSLGIVLMALATLGIKLAYVLSGDRAEIFYRQKRVGQNGKEIRIWKFRSMVPDADNMLQELLKQQEYRVQWEENQKLVNDPRITKVGKFIRKTSIDELPDPAARAHMVRDVLRSLGTPTGINQSPAS